MENNKFKVKYIRLNKPCRMTIQLPDMQNDLKFNIREVYFKEYEKTVDIFYIINEAKKLYLKAINMPKGFYYDTIMSHINVLKTGAYGIYRFNYLTMPDAFRYLAPTLAIFALINIIYTT